MRLVGLLGRPGAETPLFGRLLSARLRAELVSIPVAAAAEVRHATHLGKQLLEHTQASASAMGAPLPSRLVAPLVLPKLQRALQADAPMVLSGFPRTPDQLAMLQHAGVMEPPMIVHLTLERGEAERRLAARMVCGNCGEAMVPMPPREGVPSNLMVHMLEEATDCDAPAPTRAAIDEAEAVKRRLDAYDEQTLPLFDKLRARGAVIHEVAVLDSAEDTWDAVAVACGLEPLTQLPLTTKS